YGTRFGSRRARQSRSSSNSTMRSWTPWLIRSSAGASTSLASRYRRVTSRRPRRWVLFTEPKSRSGGRSSRQQTSQPIDQNTRSAGEAVEWLYGEDMSPRGAEKIERVSKACCVGQRRFACCHDANARRGRGTGSQVCSPGKQGIVRHGALD